MRHLNAVIVITLMVIGSGCCQTQFFVEPLPLPQRPVLPQLTASVLECLTPQDYAQLVERDRRRREYAEQLETIIKATHPE